MTSLAGKRILVLEDEVLLALDAAETLEEIGAIIIGPTHRVEAAMASLDIVRPDAALLDVNIAGSTSSAVAKRLLDEKVPFVLATGYGSRSDITGGQAVIDKPYDRKHLQAAFIRIFSRAAGRAALDHMPHAD
jgi:two-component SAPR family response regulator